MHKGHHSPLSGKEFLGSVLGGFWAVSPIGLPLTFLLGVPTLPSLGDRDGRCSGDSLSACAPRSSELQRDTSGDSRCFRSLERPRSRPPRRLSDLWPEIEAAAGQVGW